YGQDVGAHRQDVSSPEAPGSPMGSVVPPGLRLLWPHLRLSFPPTALCIMRRASALRSALGWIREGPPFTLPVCSLRAVFRTPMDWMAASVGCFTSTLAFTFFAQVRHPHRHALRRFLRGLRHEAAEFA